MDERSRYHLPGYPKSSTPEGEGVYLDSRRRKRKKSRPIKLRINERFLGSVLIVAMLSVPVIYLIKNAPPLSPAGSGEPTPTPTIPDTQVPDEPVLFENYLPTEAGEYVWTTEETQSTPEVPTESPTDVPTASPTEEIVTGAPDYISTVTRIPTRTPADNPTIAEGTKTSSITKGDVILFLKLAPVITLATLGSLVIANAVIRKSNQAKQKKGGK